MEGCVVLGTRRSKGPGWFVEVEVVEVERKLERVEVEEETGL